MVDIAKEPQTLGTIVEYRESMQSPVEHMYYIQEFVKRPPRDIRLIVAGDEVIASVYRNAPKGEWRTNVARGGTTTAFKLNKEIEDITLKAAKAVGGGILGVDAMETEGHGYTIHEVNNTVEFKGAQASTEHRIAKKIDRLRDTGGEEIDGPRRGRSARQDTRAESSCGSCFEARQGRPRLRELQKIRRRVPLPRPPQPEGGDRHAVRRKRPLEDIGRGGPRSSPRSRTGSP